MPVSYFFRYANNHSCAVYLERKIKLGMENCRCERSNGELEGSKVEVQTPIRTSAEDKNVNSHS